MKNKMTFSVKVCHCVFRLTQSMNDSYLLKPMQVHHATTKLQCLLAKREKQNLWEAKEHSVGNSYFWIELPNNIQKPDKDRKCRQSLGGKYMFASNMFEVNILLSTYLRIYEFPCAVLEVC